MGAKAERWRRRGRRLGSGKGTSEWVAGGGFWPRCACSFDRFAVSPAVRCCFVSLLIVLLAATSARAAEKSYWLRQGGDVVGKCPGKVEGVPLKAGNLTEAPWVTITGVISCRDVGNSYAFDVKFLRVEINPAARVRINRPTLNFDWLGLAVYKPADGGSRITWLYDQALPIRGSLSRSSEKSIYFGRLKFSVPKSVISQATNFMFYLTSHGPLYNFGLL